MSMDLPISIDDIDAAARRIEGTVNRTPAVISETLSAITGATVYLKFESFQFTASFKERGALNKILTLSAGERERGVLTVSAGNHAQAVAHHCNRLGIPATIVMPAHTPFSKVSRTQAFGARVVLAGDSFAEAAEKAERMRLSEGLTLVHPFDDAAVMAGQGTVALEFLAACPQIDTLVVPIGGGGLVSGCAVAARAVNPNITVIGVQAASHPGMKALMDGRTHKTGETGQTGRQTIADGIAVKTPGRLTRRVAAALVDDILLVEEDAIERAICLTAEVEKVVVEGAGAVPLAALLTHADRFRGCHAGLILSGANIDSRALAGCLMRGLVRDGRLARLSIELVDVPGALADVARIIGDKGANIIEVLHQRMGTDISLRYTTLEVQIETRDRAHTSDIVTALGAAGFPVTMRD